MRIISVDRIEEDLAVCEENGKMINIPVCELPENIFEGSIVHITESGSFVSNEDTENRRNTLFDLQNSLFDE